MKTKSFTTSHLSEISAVKVVCKIFSRPKAKQHFEKVERVCFNKFGDMDEEFEEDGWMGRHRSGEDEVCFVCSSYFSVIFAHL